MEATDAERAARNTFERLRNLLVMLNRDIPEWISAGTSYYSTVAKHNDAAAKLCYMISKLTEKELDKYIYNGRSAESRKLAEWWEKHQQADAKRLKDEQQAKAKNATRKRALAKLTKAERAALGIKEE